MKKTSLFLIITLFANISAFSQPLNYYEAAQGKNGSDLKAALHEIINNHRAYSYLGMWEMLGDADEDPENSSNVILVYTGRSQNKSYRDRGDNFSDYGKDGYPEHNNTWNREHLWAKSHGDFGTTTGIGSDGHCLKPVDRSVNSSRSYLDFDNGGSAHSEATGCKYDSDSWEPRDEVKGDVARALFYMAVRYEGTNGEKDLELVDEVNTFPDPEHGKLSTLLAWHEQDPVDDFERHRNNRIFAWQKNRNPFIDHPEYANMIWASEQANPVSLTNATITPEFPESDESIDVAATITSSTGDISSATLYWGDAFDNLTNQSPMSASGDEYTATIPTQAAGAEVFVKIEAGDGTNTNSIRGNFKITDNYTGTITRIYDIQGQASTSPKEDQQVTTGGWVTANLGESFYIQSGTGAWNGIMIYDIGRNPEIGDSVVITGTVEEYYDMTEIKPTSVRTIVHAKENGLAGLPDTLELNTGDVSQEKYEGVLINIKNAECTNPDLGYGMWEVDDGSGPVRIHNTFFYEFIPEQGKLYNITGVLNYSYSEFKIDIYQAGCVIESPDDIAPEITNVEAISEDRITVTFSEDIDAVSGLNAANYSITDGISVSEVKTYGVVLTNRVNLIVEHLSKGEHTLTVNGVQDTHGNTATNETFDFTSEYESTGVNTLKKNDVKIYPNPNTGNFSIEINSAIQETFQLQIVDLNGKIVFEKSARLFTGKNTISLSSKIKQGVYILTIKQKEKTYKQQLLIE